MKKTQLKDALRNIAKQKVSYISIILISFMAVTCFLGVSFASHSLALGGSEYYEKQNFRDIEAVSVILFNGSDLEKIAQIEGVKDVEGQNRTTAKIVCGEENPEVTVLSLTQRVNLPELVEGALPSNAGECALEPDLINSLGVKIGDTVTLDESGSALRILKEKTFTVVGVVVHPDHLVRPNPFKNYVVVAPDAFDNELLENRVVYAEIVIDKPVSINRFSQEYFDLAAPVETKLEELSVVCAGKTLTEMWERFNEYKSILRSDILKPFIAAAVSSNKGISVEEAKSVLDEAGWFSGDAEPDLKSGQIDIGTIRIFEDVSISIPKKDELSSAVPAMIEKLREALSARGIDIPQIVDPEELTGAIDSLLDKMDLSFYDKIESAVTLWNNGQQRYLVSLANGAIAEGEEKGVGVWIMMNSRMNSGYMHLSMSSDGIKSLAIRFTLLFIVVAAIVIYATVGKIVDEQRKLVGTTKAFGFRKFEVFGKYLLFGCSATLIGCILGALAGTFLLQFFAVYSYGRYYAFGTPALAVIPWQLIVVPAAGLILSAAAVRFACGRLLRSPATELMKDAVPAGKKKTKRGTGKGMSLYNKLIIRNMRTDLKRICVTVVSIAGCCALILIGFSIYLSIRNTVEKQFEEITVFDSYVTVDEKYGASSPEQINAALKEEGVSCLSARIESGALRVHGGTEPATFIIVSPAALDGYLVLKDNESGEKIVSGDDGVLIPGSYAAAYGLSAGDSCMFIDSTGAAYRAVITGIFENYMGDYIIIGPAAYETLFCKDYSPNALLVCHPQTDRETLKEKLSAIPGYCDITRSDPLRAVFDSYTDLLAIMVFILVAAAAAMSAVILTNLVNICILQKKRELTVMRVNGFTTKEVKNYVSREAIFTTVFGVILGTGAGLLQMLQIMPALGKSYTRFILTPNLIAIAAAAAITALFTVVIYRLTLRKVKDLKLTDIA